MADDKLSQGLVSQSITDQYSLAHLSHDDDLSAVDADKLKLLFDLQEQQRTAEFERQLQLKKIEHQQALEVSQNKAKEKKFIQEMIVSTVQSCYKMVISVGALAVGTVLVLKGHQQVGYFLLGGGMTSVTTDVVGIMRGVRGK